MYCPNCAEKVLENGTQFCSKCGFLTKNVENFLKDGGETENLRQNGIKQGIKLILLSLILLPVLILLIPMFLPNDTLVESAPSNTWFEQIGWEIIWTTFLAGVARIALAVVFEKKTVGNETPKQINQSRTNQTLPPLQDTPISDYGKWKITDELFEPIHVKQKTSGELG